MSDLLWVQPICVFDVIHSSQLAGENGFGWLLGITSGLIGAALIAARSRPGSSERE